MLCLRMCCRGVVQLYLLKETSDGNQARNVLPLFFSSSSRRWRGSTAPGGCSHRGRYSGQTHLGGPSPTVPLAPSSSSLDLYSRFSSPLPALFCCSFLLRITTGPPPQILSCFRFQTAPPPPEIVVDVHTVLSLLLSLCLQPAAIDCSSCCK